MNLTLAKTSVHFQIRSACPWHTNEEDYRKLHDTWKALHFFRVQGHSPGLYITKDQIS